MKTLTAGLSPKVLSMPTLEPKRLMAAWTGTTYERARNDRSAEVATWAFSALRELQYEARPTFHP